MNAAKSTAIYEYDRFGLLTGSSKHTVTPLPVASDEAVVQNTGQEAAVLLQNNDNTLPLTVSDLSSLALIGPGAGQTKATDGGGEKAVGPVEQREIYLKGFEIAESDAQPHMIMTSYNQINGSFSAANYQLLQEIARDEWHFGGVFISDWGGEQNADLCVLAGNDLAMPSMGAGLDSYYADLVRGKVPLSYAKQSPCAYCKWRARPAITTRPPPASSTK